MIPALRQHYRVVALSNTNEMHVKRFMELYRNLFDLFEKVFFSHEIRYHKPESGAFRVVLDYLAMQPDETIFLDDQQEFVDAASELGITAIRVESFDQMVSDMKAAGIRW